MNRRVLALLGSGLLLAAMLPMPATAKAPITGQFKQDGNYIVQMADLPVVAYEGGTKGLKATAPKAGKKINPNSAAVKAYTDYLAHHARHGAQGRGRQEALRLQLQLQRLRRHDDRHSRRTRSPGSTASSRSAPTSCERPTRRPPRSSWA